MHYTPRLVGMKIIAIGAGTKLREFTQHSNYLGFVHKLCMGIPSFGPYHWCAVSLQCVFLYSLVFSCTWRPTLSLAGTSCSSLPFPVVCETQILGCRIAHHWPVPVGQVQKYVQSTCTPMAVCTRLSIIQLKQKEPNTLTCNLILLKQLSNWSKCNAWCNFDRHLNVSTAT